MGATLDDAESSDIWFLLIPLVIFESEK